MKTLHITDGFFQETTLSATESKRKKNIVKIYVFSFVEISVIANRLQSNHFILVKFCSKKEVLFFFDFEENKTQ